MLLKIKLLFLKFFFGLILTTDKNIPLLDRVELFFKSLMAIAPIAFLLELSKGWVMDNKKFTTAVILIVFINMGLGAYMHLKKRNFKWQKFITKSISMILVINITYVVLELIIERAGDNFVVEGFRAALQVATLLYPGTKVLKNTFILSNGEYPPKWVMDKIYNFEKNGDLQAFLKTTKTTEVILEEIEEKTYDIQESVEKIKNLENEA